MYKSKRLIFPDGLHFSLTSYISGRREYYGEECKKKLKENTYEEEDARSIMENMENIDYHYI